LSARAVLDKFVKLVFIKNKKIVKFYCEKKLKIYNLIGSPTPEEALRHCTD